MQVYIEWYLSCMKFKHLKYIFVSLIQLILIKILIGAFQFYNFTAPPIVCVAKPICKHCVFVSIPDAEMYLLCLMIIIICMHCLFSCLFYLRSSFIIFLLIWSDTQCSVHILTVGPYLYGLSVVVIYISWALKSFSLVFFSYKTLQRPWIK